MCVDVETALRHVFDTPFATFLHFFLILLFTFDLMPPKRVLRCAPQALESRVGLGIGRESSCTAGIGLRVKDSFLS